MEVLVQQLVEANIAQQAMHQELMGALRASQVGMAADYRPVLSRFILKQIETEDIEAYFQTFERTVVREK